jgi:hypothetical protein
MSGPGEYFEPRSKKGRGMAQRSLDLIEARSVERQQGIAHLCAAGPRVVLEALLEVASGKSIDNVLHRYRKVAVSTYRMMGADVLPIHAEFEAVWRRRGAR